MALAWAQRETILQILYFLALIVDAAFCYGLAVGKSPVDTAAPVFPLQYRCSVSFGKPSQHFCEHLDSAERQLGIDLRSTCAELSAEVWKLLVLGLCLIAWLSTSLMRSVLRSSVCRTFQPVGGRTSGRPDCTCIGPGRSTRCFAFLCGEFRRSFKRDTLYGRRGPENVFGRGKHAQRNYPCCRNGRDLITVDAGIQYRIVDAAAWRYHCQNPAQALSAIAYRAVMRNTVNLDAF